MPDTEPTTSSPSRNVTTMRNLAKAGTYGRIGYFQSASHTLCSSPHHKPNPSRGKLGGGYKYATYLGVSLNHIFHLATPFLDICKHLIVAEPLGLGWPGDGVRGVPAADAAPHRRLTRDVGVEVNALGHACGCLLGYGQIGYLGRVKGRTEKGGFKVPRWREEGFQLIRV